jgi:DNA-binding transcriptional LysR family regulator
LREAKEALAHGELDLAVGFLPDLGPDCHRQPLDQEHWECLVSTDHPTIRDTLTPELYLGACHIRYEPRGAAHASLDKLLDAQLEGRSLQRRAALSVPYLSGMDRVVAGTDLVLTLPSRLAKSLSAAGRLRALPMPFDLPPIALNMQWHERVHRDLGHGWLRRTIAACYRGHRA